MQKRSDPLFSQKDDRAKHNVGGSLESLSFKNDSVTDDSIIKRMRSLHDEVSLHRGGGGSKKIERNLITTLKNDVTFPVDLLIELHHMSIAIVNSLKGYDERLLYNWKNYGEDEKKTLLILACEDAKGVPVTFIDQPYEEGKEINGCYDPETGQVELVHELVNQSLSQAAGTTIHEQAHGLIARYIEQKPDMVNKSSGLQWSSYHACDDDHQNLYDVCPEEALVRAVQMNALDMLANGTNQAKHVHHNSFSKLGYDKMASARQFFDSIKNN